MSLVLSSVRDRVADIELARYDKKNALNAEMYQALAEALEKADADPQVRSVLLHGRPECFTAGNDIHDFLDMRKRGGGAATTARFLEVLPAMQKPVVAAVGGPAVGIGTTMLLHCDFVFAAPGARFQLPFVPLGIVPEFGSSLLLPLIAGYQRAAALLLLGEPFTADQAREAGIVTAIVAEDQLLARAREAALKLAALPPESVRLTKRLLKSGFAKAAAERSAQEWEIFRERLSSPEAQEALTAFLEKRKPDFSRF